MDPVKQLVFLTGICGIGKTTYSQNIAAALGLGHGDLDDSIEKHGVSIAKLKSRESSGENLVTEDGGVDFREMESKVLRSLVNARNHVIALGGGTLMAEKNQRLIKHSGGMLIWLDADLRWVADKVASGSTEDFLMSRPYFHQAYKRIIDQHAGEGPTDSFFEAFKVIYAQRKPGYEIADIRLDLSYMSDDLVVEAVVSSIKELWQKARDPQR